ncbi:PLP-dependent aminotransferase family protein [Paenibacillus sp. MBLB4367]|uniref:aminotransferase-like domain-containing protein n=1 Tax=Paenibacillus sp. MBLB4367 TaxID=3384767 RepID=UPI0039080A58
MNKYAEIMNDIEHKIKTGTYPSGQRLPSVRAAAAHYGCGVGTIVRAYAELEKRHALYAMPQSGYYVVHKEKPQAPEASDDTIDFASASPDPDVFPYLDFQHCLNKAIDTHKYDLFTYGDSRGLKTLRQTLVSHLANDQVFTRADHMIITSGVQQALMIVTRMPFPNGKKTILVEQPSYDIYLRYLEMEHVPVMGIRRSAAGIDLERLEHLFQDGEIKFFYTMSRHHNPLGLSLSASERKKIAQFAAKYDVYVVEDDYMADLAPDSGFDPIYAYDRSSRVIYLKSFSKIIFPGLRIGVAVLPELLVDSFHLHKKYADIDTSFLSQASLDIYIKNGMYERHKHKIGAMYAERIAALTEALRPYGGMNVNPDGKGKELPHSGVYKQLPLPSTINLDRLIKRLQKRKISTVAGTGFYLRESMEREKFLRISISRSSAEKIGLGVRAIIEEIKRSGPGY